MEATNYSGYGRGGPLMAERSVWVVLIVTSGTCLSLFFACVTPFAALATLAAAKLSRRDAIATVGLVWLANQVIGYGVLGYPWTWDSLAWGLAIGISSGLSMLAARGLSASRPVTLAISLPFVAAFTVFELGLYVAGLMLPGSGGAFSAAIVGHLFLVNAIAFYSLMTVAYLGAIAGLFARSDQPDLLSYGALS